MVSFTVPAPAFAVRSAKRPRPRRFRQMHRPVPSHVRPHVKALHAVAATASGRLVDFGDHRRTVGTGHREPHPAVWIMGAVVAAS